MKRMEKAMLADHHELPEMADLGVLQRTPGDQWVNSDHLPHWRKRRLSVLFDITSSLHRVWTQMDENRNIG